MFKVLGIDRDCDQCECCGKTNLKLTVILGRLDADKNVSEVVRFGRDCAARATRLRRTGTAMESLAVEAQRQADELERRTPVVIAPDGGDVLWIIEEISGNGAKVEWLRCAKGGGYHAVETWARKTYPHKELIVRKAR